MTVVVWKNLSGGLFDIYEIVPGILFAFILIIVVSLFGKKPADEIKEEFSSMIELNSDN